MAKRIKEYFQKIKQKRETDAWKSGYDYAVGSILREEETPISIEANYYGQLSRHQFDKGCDAGIDKLISLGYQDDRI